MMQKLFLIACLSLPILNFGGELDLIPNSRNKPCCSSFIKKMVVYGYLGTVSVSLTVVGAMTDNTACLGVAFCLGSLTTRGIQQTYQKEKSKRIVYVHDLVNLPAANNPNPARSHKAIGSH